ncbi:hypothetical protein AMATHDRAFT_48845 [Amanita thiersii Skay4041]|uniref:Uncharacterized protein n=1 Tax=Amanita thiersii Skay4041 TaxID=703135 RepID=A0A2A9NNN8_9AGAR|nr:hypothetical protein AMATHDRAFT_48845 [Amanita thiersii Skay4041]
MSLVLVVFLSLLHTLGVYAGSTHTVQVGQEGSFYNPDWVNAVPGDTVKFFFTGPNHSVVQTTFESPCVPLKGGFNSDTPTPVWDLMITNDTEPFGSNLALFVINLPPASASMFSSFQAAAKAITGTPPPVPSITLSGVGAFATAPPTFTTTPITTPASSLSSSTSLVSTSTVPAPAPISHKSNHAGAIAGAVCGVLGGLLVLLCLFVLYRRRFRKPQPGKANGEGGIHPITDVNGGSIPKGSPSMGSSSTGGYNGGGVGGSLPMKVERTGAPVVAAPHHQNHPSLLTVPTVPQSVYTYHSNSSGSQIIHVPSQPVELANQRTPPSGGSQISYFSNTGSGPVASSGGHHGTGPVSMTSSPSFSSSTGAGVGAQQFQPQHQQYNQHGHGYNQSGSLTANQLVQRGMHPVQEHSGGVGESMRFTPGSGGGGGPPGLSQQQSANAWPGNTGPGAVAAPTPRFYVMNNADEQGSDAGTRVTPAPPYEENDHSARYPGTGAAPPVPALPR